jgi:hypothetical protein
MYDLYKKCSWHPFWYNNNNENLAKFEKALEILNLLRSNLSSRASEGQRSVCDLYEIQIKNDYHPQKHIESWWWVNSTNLEEIFPSEQEIHLLNEFGWHIKIITN